MLRMTPPEELTRHIAMTTGLTAEQADRAIREVVHYYASTTEDFIVARHRELQLAGAHNAEIFSTIETELSSRLVLAEPMNQRKIRRVIYG